MKDSFESIEDVQKRLGDEQYICGKNIATVVYLSQQLNKPVLVEGPAGTQSLEVDLRGLTVEEALAQVDQTIDGLIVSGGSWIRIIHGKGTGALRTAITEQLQDDSRVKSFRLGEPGEGGSGVTIAVLR